ncbi:MAG: hypothetical protein HDT33_02785 [Clostridiales bacterium]|nr:hypothetical protein [Clostridiales bacterium]
MLRRPEAPAVDVAVHVRLEGGKDVVALHAVLADDVDARVRLPILHIFVLRDAAGHGRVVHPVVVDQRVKVRKISNGKYTVAEWVRLWFETYSKPSIREQAAYYYNNYIEKHIVPGIGNIKLDKLTTLQIQQFYNRLKTSGRVQRYAHIELKDKGLSNRFIRGVHGVLNSALEQAVKERLITSNPAEGCKLPKIEKKEMKVLLPEQISAYLQEANKRGRLPAYYLELTSGLRRGELLALLWTDLDVENMTISVTKQVNRINVYWSFWHHAAPHAPFFH